MNDYLILKKQHQKEYADFKGIFFAFNEKQFNEGKEKLGITDNKELYSLGIGCFILKSRSADLKKMLDRHNDEMETLLKNDDFLLQALCYELQNHEYCITYDLTPTLDALNLKREDIKPNILKTACLMATEQA